MREVDSAELYKEILQGIFQQERIQVSFPNLPDSIPDLVELRCFQAIQAIKEIIQDPELDDPTCFAKVEGIVCILESLGSSGGFRHDFG